jgi:hypothetical protein
MIFNVLLIVMAMQMHGLLPAGASESTGMQVNVTGVLVDKYCWNDLGGVALDTSANLKLNPTKHTVHCLVEVGICRNSGYVMVHKSSNTGQYEIQYELDEPSNELARNLMYEVPPNERNEATGYAITVSGTVAAGSNVLAADTMTGEVPEPPTNAPTKAETGSPTGLADTRSPTMPTTTPTRAPSDEQPDAINTIAPTTSSPTSSGSRIGIATSCWAVTGLALAGALVGIL